MNKKKLWYPAAMVIALSVAFGTAQAKSLEQVGAAEGRAEPLKTYGVDVSAKSGLKTLLPSGWNLFIYKNTNLPQSISWTVGDTWIGALEKFADKNELAVRLDWSKRAVYVSSPEVAIEARAKLAEIDNAARTPLPAYSPAVTVAKTAVAAAPIESKTPVAAVNVSAPAAQPRVPADLLARALAATAPKTAATAPIPAAPAASLTAPTPATIAVASAPVALPIAPVAAAASPVVVSSAPIQSAPAAPAPFAALLSRAPVAMPYSVPVVAPAPVVSPAPDSASDAFARGNMEDIVRKTAQKLGYQVSWETVTLPLTGPVTFLGVDAAEDMRLLQKSLGLRQSPIAIEVYRGSSVIRVTASAEGKEPLAVYNSTYSGLIGYGEKTNAATAWSDSLSVSAGLPRPVIAKSPSVSLPVAPVIPVVRAAAPLAAPVVPAVAVAPAPVAITLTVAKGESLSKAISHFLKEQGWELKWQVPNDMEADFPFKAEGASIAQVLNALLPRLGLDTDMYAPSKMVVVRPIDNTAE